MPTNLFVLGTDVLVECCAVIRIFHKVISNHVFTCSPPCHITLFDCLRKRAYSFETLRRCVFGILCCVLNVCEQLNYLFVTHS